MFAHHSELTFTDLFEYIQKNTELKQAIELAGKEEQKLTALYTAVKSGDIDARIFFDPDCDVLLLRLFRDGQIKAGEFITAYNFLMALMQFSSEVPLTKDQWGPEKNKGLKVDKVCLVRLVSDNALTPEGKEYIHLVKENFKLMMNVDIDLAKLEEKILALDPLEQTLLYIESKYRSYGFKLLFDSVEVLPSVVAKKGEKYIIHRPRNFMVPPIDEEQFEQYPFFPSFSLQKYFLETCSEEPMQITPRFGQVGKVTLLKMHRNNQHFKPLYNQHVKSNLVIAHGLKEGPFSNAKHDESHPFLAVMLDKKIRDEILNQIIPALLNKIAWLDTLQDTNPYSRTAELKTQLEYIVYDELNDFTVFPLWKYKDKSQEQRRDIFIIGKAFDFGDGRGRVEPWSSLMHDLIYIILLLAKTKENTALWEMLQRYKPAYVERSYVQALERIAAAEANPTFKQSMSIPPEMKVSIDWDAWRDKLSKTSDSAEIWQWISSAYQLENDFVKLTQCGLVYYHPYVPLTPEKHTNLLEFITQHSPAPKAESSSTLPIFRR